MKPAIQVWSDGPMVYCMSPSGTKWPDGYFHTTGLARARVSRMIAGEVASYDIDGRRPIFTRRKVNN